MPLTVLAMLPTKRLSSMYSFFRSSRVAMNLALRMICW